MSINNILAVFLVISMSICLTWLGIRLYDYGWFRGRPELVANLPRDKNTMEMTLRQGLLEKFPVGSSSFKLTRYLNEHGFSPHWGTHEGRNTASYLKESFCPERWTVYWSEDRRNKLTAIETDYTDYC